MKKILTLLLVLSSIALSAQTTKGSFMVGGNGSFDINTSSSDGNARSKSTGLTLNPTVGYFLVNNFSAGLSVPFGLSWSTTTIPSLPTEYDGNTYSVGVAPFCRYYIPVKSFAIITQAGYGWYYSKNSFDNIDAGTGAVIGTSEWKEKYRTLTLAAGPTFFLSPYTGIEILANYQHSNFSEFDRSQFYISIGFQIYLPSNRE